MSNMEWETMGMEVAEKWFKPRGLPSYSSKWTELLNAVESGSGVALTYNGKFKTASTAIRSAAKTRKLPISIRQMTDGRLYIHRL